MLADSAMPIALDCDGVLLDRYLPSRSGRPWRCHNSVKSIHLNRADSGRLVVQKASATNLQRFRSAEFEMGGAKGKKDSNW